MRQDQRAVNSQYQSRLLQGRGPPHLYRGIHFLYGARSDCGGAAGERFPSNDGSRPGHWWILILKPHLMERSEAKADTTIVRPGGFTPSLSSMDVPRPDFAAKKRKRRIMMISSVAVGLILATFALSRLKPAVPSVDRSTVWIDTVKRGPMVRQVRGLGTLVPEVIRWIPTNTEGSVEKIVVWPGTKVEADTVILELTSAEL